MAVYDYYNLCKSLIERPCIEVRYIDQGVARWGYALYFLQIGHLFEVYVDAGSTQWIPMSRITHYRLNNNEEQKEPWPKHKDVGQTTLF